MLNPIKLANKNFLSSLDTSREEFFHLLDLAKNFKNKDLNIELKDKVLGLIFDKSSTRTRVSFQVAMSRLGGTTIDLNPTTSQIGRGEPIKDTARVLSRYCDLIAITSQYLLRTLAVSLIGSPLPICDVVGLRSIVVPPSLVIAT